MQSSCGFDYNSTARETCIRFQSELQRPLGMERTSYLEIQENNFRGRSRETQIWQILPLTNCHRNAHRIGGMLPRSGGESAEHKIGHRTRCLQKKWFRQDQPWRWYNIRCSLATFATCMRMQNARSEKSRRNSVAIALWLKRFQFFSCCHTVHV